MSTDAVTRIAVPVETRSPTGTTNAYVVGDDPALVVDPAGTTHHLETMLADRRVAHVAVTHTHSDHVGGVAALAERHGATVWCRRGRGEEFTAATGVEPDRTFAEGTTIPTGAGDATVLDLQGHAPDHVGLRVGDAVLCGDVAVAEGSVVVAAPEGDLRAYLTALRRLRAMAPGRLLPGHGPSIADPPATCERLLRHRLDRERAVRAAVLAGASDPAAVVDAAYEKDLTGVRDLARATVVAHLEKLTVEGDVAWEPDRERASPA